MRPVKETHQVQWQRAHLWGDSLYGAQETLSEVVTFELRNEKVQMEGLLRHLQKFHGKNELVESVMNHDETGDQHGDTVDHSKESGVYFAHVLG